MEQEILNFIRNNTLSLFKHTEKSTTRKITYKTKDARAIQTRVLDELKKEFSCKDTHKIFDLFDETEDENIIQKRQNYFKTLKLLGPLENEFLKKLTIPHAWWKPVYDVLVVTENAELYTKLKERNCPVKLLISENDVSLLEQYDLVQVLECDDYAPALATLPQAVFIKTLNEAYLERHLERLSAWTQNIEILQSMQTTQTIHELLKDVNPLLQLLNTQEEKNITYEELERALEEIQKTTETALQTITLSGSALIDVISKKIIPPQIKEVVRDAVRKTKIPEHLFILGIPTSINEEEAQKYIKKHEAEKFTKLAEAVKKNAVEIQKIPEKLRRLQEEIILFDFVSGMSKYIARAEHFPEIADVFEISFGRNMFLSEAQPISFMLSDEFRCSILTGANSGGKTTLLEHIIQITVLTQLGLPVKGKVKTPLFTDVYYFAKNKGSASKGAFETLLTELSKIRSTKKTLLLADEIEAVTEPGVAGRIIAETATYFLNQGCFMVIATHLGHEVQKALPEKARIDGIEAKGLDEQFELIVDHNPVLGRLAHSTPELIIERLAKTKAEAYFKHLYENLKKRE